MEEPLDDVAVEDGCFNFAVRPFEIKSFRVSATNCTNFH